MNAKVLLVDDEAVNLEVIARSLTSAMTAAERADAPEFAIETAGTPDEALALVSANGPYAVILSDYRMPGMNGVELLERARAIEPSTVRMMLTGHADVDMAINAVNCGAVFRFLTKPCPPKVLTAAVVVGLQHYQLIHAEREVLEHIPRFGDVAAIIAAQRDPVDPGDVGVQLPARDDIRLGGQVLRVAIEFDIGLSAGLSREGALARLRQRPGEFDPELVRSLKDVMLPFLEFEGRTIALSDPRAGMLFDEDLRSEEGLLLMSRGQEITNSILARLHSVAPKAWLATKVRVLTAKLTVDESIAPPFDA